MTSLRRYVHEEESIGALLSGGFDSSIVAAVAARVIGKPIRTYGLISRETGETVSECAARNWSNALDLKTRNSIPRTRAPRSGERAHSELRVVPWEECYYEAFDSLLVRAVQRGDRTLATGNGGDELCMPHWTERPPSASQPVRAVPPFLNAKTVQTYRDTEMTVERAPSRHNSNICPECLGSLRSSIYAPWSLVALADVHAGVSQAMPSPAARMAGRTKAMVELSA